MPVCESRALGGERSLIAATAMRRDFALSLNPVSFRYHKQYDASQTIAFGLIAEEVAEVNPNLVGRNPEGQPESVTIAENP